MYPSKGSGAYGQQSYSGQQAYGQIPGAGDVSSQHAIESRQSMMGAAQETDLSGYRAHSVQGAQYGGPYATLYGSTALSNAHQAAGVGGKGSASLGLQGRYPSAFPDTSKFSSAALGSNLGMNSDDYASASSRGYTQKTDPFSAVKSSDYSSMDLRHYGDQAAYLGRDLQNDPARRYADSVSMSQQHQADMHDQMDQASLLRQQQILKAQSLQFSSDMRQAEYLAARAALVHHGSQKYSSYGGRMDVDPRTLPILGSGPYGGQHAASILGGAPGRNFDELYTQGSSSAAYSVGLPPGRNYAGKGLHGPSLDSHYQALSRAHPSLGVSIVDERKDDRSDYRQELERDEECHRELIREKEKEHEREERQCQRERDRERERLLERRDRERERDRKRASDARRERSPTRSTREHRGSSLLKDERSHRVSPRRSSPCQASPRRATPRRATARRVSPRREVVHRHRSPVKEKKREYICKVYPFCLVDAERDYLSLNKRYPRLFISPECTKVVLHWPKQSLHLSLHTPVSFEHEYVELDNKDEDKALVPLGLKHGNTVWNAKVILMSGMSTDALNEMCSYKSSDERIVHFNNILRFAILKKDRSVMAIGGPWNAAIDGGDPSVEDSALIQTACRYLKDITQLDLQNCQHWNRFLEIHYDRVGEDGLFSHKEVTVLFVPDLSECFPLLDVWRTQWFAHKKAVAERERKLAAKDKRSAEKKEPEPEKVKVEGSAGKSAKVVKTDSDVTIPEKEVDTVKADDKDAIKESDKKNAVDQKGKGHLVDEKLEEESTKGPAVECKTDGTNVTDGANADPTVDRQKPVKRKVVKRVVKGKVAGKKASEATVADAAAKVDDKVDAKDEGDKQRKQENVIKEEDAAESGNVKTFTRKKIIKRVPAGKSAQKVENTLDVSVNQSEKKPEIGTDNQGEKKVKKEPDEAATPQETGVKTTGKKKIIRRVIKRKAFGTKEKNVNAIKEEAGDENDNAASQKIIKVEETKDDVEKKDEGTVGTSKSKDKMISEEAKTQAVEKGNTTEKKEKTEKDSKKGSRSNEQNSKSEKGVSKSSAEPEDVKDKDSKKNDHGSKKERTKDEKENKSKNAKHDSKQKSQKEMKEKGKSEEPPQHPGLFLETKRSKGSKIRSMSLSLDGLLDYNDKDIEESTFELSVFAESLNELLQHQMGCRLLSFLEKLRRRYVIKKNQRKRQRDEKAEKENDSSTLKRSKVTDDSAVQNQSSKSGNKDAPDQRHDETMAEGGSAAKQNEPKMENKSDDNDEVEDELENKSDDENGEAEEEEEDPEEIIEDDQEMDDVAPSDDRIQKDENAAKTDDLKSEPEKVTAVEDNGGKKMVNEMNSNNVKPVDEKSDKEKKDDDKRSDTAKSDSVKEYVVDKEALQAFRYFDHNRVGYIMVEDLRCLLHNLGKFLSHRDVKELVQSALFESNTARDNRIFYKKLVKLTDI